MSFVQSESKKHPEVIYVEDDADRVNDARNGELRNFTTSGSVACELTAHKKVMGDIVVPPNIHVDRVSFEFMNPLFMFCISYFLLSIQYIIY